MTAPNVRSFYAALGIELPAWTKLEAPVRCFAEPDAHHRSDRSPSCSINLLSGAWNCHGCGAHGGAYDAALAAGHTPRSAIDLMIAHGLVVPRVPDVGRAYRRPVIARAAVSPAPTVRSLLTADETDVRLWAEMLHADGRLIRRLILERAWAPRIMRELELGFDGARVTIPVRDRLGELRGVLRYDAFGPRDPKMRAVPGTQLGLVPHPAREASDHVILVEGPPDMIAARSAGLPAVAIPGTSAWKQSWAGLLEGRRVTIVMDCDEPGRHGAGKIAASLGATAVALDVVDLWPDRRDGYDLTDRILERRSAASRPSAPRTMQALLLPNSSRDAIAASARPRTLYLGRSKMTTGTNTDSGQYTKQAHAAILVAVRNQHDFGGWLAGVLSSVAADLGSADALTAGRPGSWEADHVRGLVKGTVGWGDEFLANCKDPV